MSDLAVERLKQRKRKLAARLAAPPAKTLREQILSELSSLESQLATQRGSVQLQQQIEKEMKLHQYNDIQIAYRLTGTTVFQLPEKGVGLRFETFANGMRSHQILRDVESLPLCIAFICAAY